ncbi:SdpI/YhfL protein family protein [Aequorivita viscosa]|uniref:SdpI/YhfL protein family protein n=2 Tax=Aequorivita viscosa TaxID=797419 RepID=A0A1M6LJG5_9FLAO|nr:SdpI/YhfL protein family protein [Aequorivita viscosa]SHJ71299.1 SdpI/YhfL protein family protein [Aequorivita viscosa]
MVLSTIFFNHPYSKLKIMETLKTLLVVPLLSGAIFILAGLIMFVFPPKNINGLYGYRTSNSMKSQERWEFAQKYSSLEMMKFGGILMLTSILGFIIEPNGDTPMVIGLGLMIAMVIVLLIRVEKALKKRFPE